MNDIVFRYNLSKYMDWLDEQLFKADELEDGMGKRQAVRHMSRRIVLVRRLAEDLDELEEN